MSELPKLDIADELKVRARVEAARCACLAEELVEYKAAELIPTQSALLAQMAAALGDARSHLGTLYPGGISGGDHICVSVNDALTAYAAMSPDPQWQRVPEGCVVVPQLLTGEMATAFDQACGLYLNYEDGYGDDNAAAQAAWDRVLEAILKRARGEV